MSSTNFCTPVRPARAASDLAHHSSELADNPIGARVYLYRPDGKRNVVNSEDSSSRPIWKYPCTASNFAKSLASGPIARNMSTVDGKGWTGRLTYLFSLVKSVTMRTPFPPSLGTKCAGLIQAVGLSTRSIMPFPMSSSTTASASLRKCRGICLAVKVRYGIASLSRKIFIGAPAMGASVILSTRTSG